VRPRRKLGDFEFAWIPPGTFLMGRAANEPGTDRDEQQHRVTLTRGFWIGIYPVTQAQWRDVMGNNPSHFSRDGNSRRYVQQISEVDLERFPVENISWNMARDFCATLSQQFGQVITLPTEAQWEYACRSGTTTPFHFGAALNGTQANCAGDHPFGLVGPGPALARPTPVGLPAYPPNAWGLHEMHGNVFDWCLDVYRSDYENLSAADPLFAPAPETSVEPRHILRGGAWGTHATYCRSATRFDRTASARYAGYGCRLVLPAAV
jgi:formylglycine-generating enzyme required for sulfatase activity